MGHSSLFKNSFSPRSPLHAELVADLVPRFMLEDKEVVLWAARLAGQQIGVVCADRRRLCCRLTFSSFQGARFSRVFGRLSHQNQKDREHSDDIH